MLLKDSGHKEYENPTPDTYGARCIKVIDIGTQAGSYQGKATSSRKMVISWELDSLMKDGRPFVVQKTYTASMNEKAMLRKDMEGWRGAKYTEEQLLAGIDLKKILGSACMISMVQNDNYVNVGSISKVPKGMLVPAQVNPSVYFNLEDFDQDVFDSLTEYQKKKIMGSPEWEGRSMQPPVAKETGQDGKAVDEIPF